jgi:hypothetical protein
MEYDENNERYGLLAFPAWAVGLQILANATGVFSKSLEFLVNHAASTGFIQSVIDNPSLTGVVYSALVISSASVIGKYVGRVSDSFDQRRLSEIN